MTKTQTFELVETQIHSYYQKYPYSPLTIKDVEPYNLADDIEYQTEEIIDEIVDIASFVLSDKQTEFNKNITQEKLNRFVDELITCSVYGVDSALLLPTGRIEYKKHIIKDGGDSEDDVEVFVYEKSSDFIDSILSEK